MIASTPILVLLASSGLASQNAELDRLSSEAIRSLRIPGLSVAVVRDTQLVYEKGFGSTSLTESRPASAATQYRLASVTKVFTATAILQLVEAGKIDLDRPARSSCPEISTTAFAPTVRQLLLHQGGIRHTSDREDVTIRGPYPRLGAALTSVVKEPLADQPGTRTRYSSWGYAVLGCVIESQSGKPYIDYLREHVFVPAGMGATVQDQPDFSSAEFSPGFRGGLAGRLRPSEVVDTRFKASSSGLISTVHDLALFSIALYRDKLLSPRTRAMMFESVPAPPGEPRFTLGWTIAQDRQFGQAFWFNGSMEGTTAILYLVPERGYAAVILANRERHVRELLPLLRSINLAMLGPTGPPRGRAG